MPADSLTEILKPFALIAALGFATGFYACMALGPHAVRLIG
jgi:hypothetical protein